MHWFLVMSALIAISCYQLESSKENREHRMTERDDNTIEELENAEDDFGDNGDMKEEHDSSRQNDPWFGRRRRRWFASRRRCNSRRRCRT